MYEVFTKLLNMSLTASILVLIIIILRFALKKAPKWIYCILWVMVAIRLICPLTISSRFSAYNLFANRGDEIVTVIEGVSLPDIEITEDTYNYETWLGVGDKTMDNINVEESGHLEIETCIGYAWVVGAVAMLMYAIVSYLVLKRQVKVSVRQCDNVYVCDEINSPFILGIISPRIYLPSGMSEEVSVNVIAHEKAHIKRFDYLWKPLGFVLLSVYWFNPVMWVSYVLLCKDIEAACDEKVISQMDKDGIACYSQSLLACAVKRRMITACPVAFGETDVKGRIKNVLNYKKPAFWIVCLSIIACIVVAVCFLTNPKEETVNLEVATGLYTNNDLGENPMLSASGLLINDDGTFSFSPSVISSYMGDGTWETDGEYVIFNDRGMGDNRKIVFLSDNGNLIFDADRSDSNSMWGISDGAEFVYRDKMSLLEYLVDKKEVVETNAETNETEEPQPSEYQDIKAKLFEEISGEYWMLSGAGAWSSRFFLYSDGYFVGLYEDADGSSIDRCEFTGHFINPAQIDENTYLVQIEELSYEEPGRLSSEHDSWVTTTTPYGFENATSMLIYATGTSVSSLSEDEYFGLSAEREEFWDKYYEKSKDVTLPCYTFQNKLNGEIYLFFRVH